MCFQCLGQWLIEVCCAWNVTTSTYMYSNKTFLDQEAALDSSKKPTRLL